MNRHRSGFVMILVLLLLSVALVMLTNLSNRVVTYRQYSRLFADREKAKALALSGVQLAISQLLVDEKNQGPGDQKKMPLQELQLQAVMRAINRWQRYELQEDIDGIAGEVGFFLASEDGKINLNQLWDFDKKSYRKTAQFDGLKVAQALDPHMKKLVADEPFSLVFDRLCKARAQPFDDVTQLMLAKEFTPSKDSLFPLVPDAKKNDEKTSIALTDLFTIFSAGHELQPAVLSRSLDVVLGLKPLPGTLKERESLLQTIKTAQTVQQQWETSLGQFYGKGLSALPPELKGLFGAKFGVTNFSVISYGTVGSVTQKLCAIIAQRQSPQDKHTSYAFIRLFWL